MQNSGPLVPYSQTKIITEAQWSEKTKQIPLRAEYFHYPWQTTSNKVYNQPRYKCLSENRQNASQVYQLGLIHRRIELGLVIILYKAMRYPLCFFFKQILNLRSQYTSIDGKAITL